MLAWEPSPILVLVFVRSYTRALARLGPFWIIRVRCPRLKSSVLVGLGWAPSYSLYHRQHQAWTDRFSNSLMQSLACPSPHITDLVFGNLARTGANSETDRVRGTRSGW
ncbi:hypothetical protein BD289DRAFT_444966 [Coniella lustricola]|uniref:Uncharacterized protein n=1 Tax=Coniella lustricola TaxID=2025994 RepID=A0A2T2ZVG9_9PEZI|nr:hypothetical protein BD289DRAFT_444966 [Coniella lustricola]